MPADALRIELPTPDGVWRSKPAPDPTLPVTTCGWIRKLRSEAGPGFEIVIPEPLPAIEYRQEVFEAIARLPEKLPDLPYPEDDDL